jgi:hypothetical protein
MANSDREEKMVRSAEMRAKLAQVVNAPTNTDGFSAHDVTANAEVASEMERLNVSFASVVQLLNGMARGGQQITSHNKKFYPAGWKPGNGNPAASPESPEEATAPKKRRGITEADVRLSFPEGEKRTIRVEVKGGFIIDIVAPG